MTQEELQALCGAWQKRLRLQDWDISVGFARARDLEEPGSEGQVRWILERRQAVIKVLDPVDYQADALVPADAETALVHELVHLLFAPFEASEGLEQVAQEQAIDALSRVLVGMAREAVIG